MEIFAIKVIPITLHVEHGFLTSLRRIWGPKRIFGVYFAIFLAIQLPDLDFVIIFDGADQVGLIGKGDCCKRGSESCF